MRQRPRLLQSYFDSISTLYDHATKHPAFRWTAPRIVRELLSSKLQSNRPGSVLDIGIGTGQAVYYLYRRGWKVTGIDLSPNMITLARRKLPQARLVTANVEQHPPRLSKNAFDLVVSVGTFEFISNLGPTINWIADRLKPGGYICFTYELFIPNSKHHQWKVSELGRGAVNPIPAKLKFPVFRRTPRDIRRLLSRSGLQACDQKQFVAYVKQGHIPVHYQAILAQKIIAVS